MAGNLTAMIASIFSGGVTADPYYEYTTLLLPGNGTNGAQNNTFLDGSTNNFTITRNGNTTQGTFSPFSQTGWGNYFDGTGDYLALATGIPVPSTGTFTIEAWVYLTDTTDETVWTQYSAGTAGRSSLRISSGKLTFANPSASTITTTASVLTNAWAHVAAVRDSSNNLMLFINGNLDVTSASYTASIQQIAATIGAFSDATSALSGYISNLRITNTAVYTASFTPPTAPLTAISGTSLLTCQSNRFRDASSNNFTITRNGDTSVVAFSPFNPTASWSAATYGGSGYFDGSSDYITAPNTCATLGAPSGNTNDFTVEAFFYPTGTGIYTAIGTTYSTSNYWALNLNRNSSTGANAIGRVAFYMTDSFNVETADSKLIVNQWNHIAVVRTSTTVSIFVNGTREATNTSSVDPNPTGVLQVGKDTVLNRDYPGYVSNVRIVRGATQPYSASSTSITVPTAPLTAITNTSLLLNFTNAGIYDAAGKNDLETVGNAQISTTQSKFGGSSISFDGTGDWLLIPDQPPQRIGTGNFTVEMWVYRNSSGTYGLAGKGTGTTGWLVSLNSSNQVVFTYGSSTITSTGTVSATTWTHIAVVREGTSTNQTKIYINGTNDGTGTVSTDFNQTNSMYIGADRTGGSAANAYVQDVRITNYARYTDNFTAPTAAFPTL